jgi:hypothetical protein
LVGKPELKKSLANPKLRWEDSITMDLETVGWEVVSRINLSKDRV